MKNKTSYIKVAAVNENFARLSLPTAWGLSLKTDLVLQLVMIKATVSKLV